MYETRVKSDFGEGSRCGPSETANTGLIGVPFWLDWKAVDPIERLMIQAGTSFMFLGSIDRYHYTIASVDSGRCGREFEESL